MLRLVLLLVLVVVVATVFWRVVDAIIEGASGTGEARQTGGSGKAGTSDQRSGQIPRSVEMARDPVCGTFVVPERAVTLGDGPTRVYFCSTACRDTYRTSASQEARPA